MRPLIYLAFRQFINNLKYLFTSPKRLIPLILIMAWLGFSMLPALIFGISPAASQTSGYPMNMLNLGVIRSAVFALLALITLSTIHRALADGLLIFSAAQIDFLFPTPIPRRAVLFLKLMGDYLKYGLTILFFFTLAAPQLYIAAGATNRLSIVVAAFAILMLLIMTMNLTHTINIVATAGIQRLQIASRLVKIGILAATCAVLITGIIHYSATGNVAASFAASTQSTIARIVFLPVTCCTDIVVSPINGTIGKISGELFGLILGAGLSLLLLLARPENFYEPSLGVSAKFAKIRSLSKSGDFAAARLERRKAKGAKTYDSSPIPPFGTGASALLWKELVTRIRMMRKELLGFLLLPPVLAYFIGRYALAELQSLVVFAIPYITFFMAQAAQNDIRSNLAQANIIKPMPLSGKKVITTLVFSSWLTLFFVVSFMAVSFFVFMPHMDRRMLTILTVASLTGGFVLTCGSSIIAMIYPNAKDKLQMMIPSLIGMFMSGLILIPTLVITGVAISFGANAIISALALILVNALVSWGLIYVASEDYAKFDPTD